VLRAEEARRRGWLVVRVLVAVVVVLLCAIFLAILFPPYNRYPCRSQQSEAKGNLKALYVAEESYRVEFDVYNADTHVIGFTPFSPKGAKIRYRYVVTDVDDGAAPEQSFRAWAFRIDGERDDLWTIDAHNDLENVVNGCEE